MTFPLDDLTLTMIESSLDTRMECDPGGEPHPEGDGFTLVHLLKFLSGESATSEEGSVTVVEKPQYSEGDLIRALVSEVRRLRAKLPENDHDPGVP